MKRILSVIAILAVCSSSVLATKTTTTTTVTVHGKNTGSTVNPDGSATINCDQVFLNTCYTVTTTTTTESNVQINHGENIIVTAYDINGENPQVLLNGNFDWADIESNGSELTATFAIISE